MSDTISVTVSGQDREIPRDFGSSAGEFARACGYTGREYDVYRVGHLDAGADVKPEDKCGEPMVVDDGDEFVVVPRYVTGGG